MIMKKIQIFIIMIIFFFQILYSAEDGKKKLTIKDALIWKIPSSIAISPRGDRIAFVVTKPDFEKSIYERNIWIINIGTGMVRQFTYGSKNEFSPEFSPYGRYISFIAKRNGKNEKDEKNQIWMIPVSGGDARKLTSAEEGIIRYKWSPDGENVFYTTKEALPKGVKSRKEKDKKIKNDAYVVDKENYRIEIWSINITTKNSRRLFKGDYGLSDIEVSPDGEKILYTTNYTGKPDHKNKFDIWELSIKDGKTVKITKREGGERSPKWSPDGKSVAFLAGEYPEITYSQTDLFIVPSSDAEIKNITTEFDKSVSNIQWSKDGKNVFCNVSEGFYTGIYKIDVKTGRAEPVMKGDLNITQYKLYEGESLIYILENSNKLPDIFISDSDGGSSRQLTYLNPEIEEFDLAEQEIIKYNSKDGLKIEGLLVKPTGFQKGKKYPLIVYVHGGPHGRVRNTLLSSMEFQTFASEGYIVFSPNFRGSSGYEGSFDIANKGDIGGMDYEDIMSGVDYLVNLGIADLQRMGITGGSYGGYMTNWTISQTKRFKAAISKYGIFNLITDFSNSNIPSWEKNYLEYYYWDNLDIYLKHSPSNYVKNIDTPVLIMHGDEDPNTFISNSKEMYTALTLLGKTVEFVRYPREGHGIREPNHRLDLMERCLNWFGKYLKDLPEAKNVGDIVFSGDWGMKVTEVNKIDSHSDKKEVTIEVKLNFIGENTKKIEIDIESDIYIVLEGGNEISPEGLMAKIQDKEVVIAGGKYSISQIYDESKGNIIPLTLRFKVPKDMKKAKLKVKDFPFIFINL